ncbi:DUF2332 domain-containing protein [Zafaria sp. Z1313]|uniref:DUF2332 domain-containing protein n=1 Tax=unclassified Zafaria TaxID=2828765 RepID=UPI002E779FEE|nr:DUF2332 domain-containing protein [Zafaria sp. J156]MEE1621360.1 DUF2332 domain-containing protein [Zafaria sp. J156]
MTVGATAAMFQEYARTWFPGHSDAYAQWAAGVAADEGLLELLVGLPSQKRQPNLVFAAARYLGFPDGDFEELAAFLRGRWEEVAAVVLARRTQTNEPGRCATLLPAFARIAEETGRPLSLIEVGPSAGLCLLPDLYSYEYDAGARLGSGTPVLSCTTSGAPPVPARLPEVAWRAGVDLNPLDGRDPDTVRWLECLVWPGQEHRLARLREALATLQSLGPGVPRLRQGDLNEHIADLVAEAPAGTTPVVFHSAVLAYLSPYDRSRFARTVRSLDCRWVSNESFFMEPAGETVPSGRPGWFTLAVDGVPVAHTGQHGAELHWLEGA